MKLDLAQPCKKPSCQRYCLVSSKIAVTGACNEQLAGLGHAGPESILRELGYFVSRSMEI